MPGLAGAVEHGHAVDAGHDEVEEDEGDRAACRGLRGSAGPARRLGGLRLEAEPLDDLFEDATLGGIVIDDQNALDHVTLNSTQLTATDASTLNAKAGEMFRN